MPIAAPTLCRPPRLAARVLATLSLALAAVALDAGAAAAQVAGPFSRMPEVANYRLTVPVLEKFVAATNALKALEESEFDLESGLNIDDPAEMTVDDIAAAFDSEPLIRGAIEGAGLSSREYVTFMMAMLQSMMGWAMVQMGGEQALRDMPAGVMKDNIQFFLDHRDTFESLDG